MDQATVNYVPALIVFVVASLLAGSLLLISHFVGRRRPSESKLMPYECGVEPVGTARERLSVKFYLVAMVFLLFDIEAVFLVPWGATFLRVLEDPTYRPLRYVFYGEMMLFMLVLLVGLIYVWRKGALDWNR
jgi:NADH-quinone oxidoreductase subunit A